MFYTYLRGLVAFILWVLNGNAHYHHKDNIPDRKENYILVSPHRTWWDPVYMAFATKPKQFIFMAKKELFTNRIFGWWIRMCGAFPIDRKNPGQPFFDYVPKWKSSFSRRQRRCCHHCQNGEGPYHASDLYWSKRLERVVNG